MLRVAILTTPALFEGQLYSCSFSSPSFVLQLNACFLSVCPVLKPLCESFEAHGPLTSSGSIHENSIPVLLHVCNSFIYVNFVLEGQHIILSRL